MTQPALASFGYTSILFKGVEVAQMDFPFIMPHPDYYFHDTMKNVIQKPAKIYDTNGVDKNGNPIIIRIVEIIIVD